MIKQAHCVSHLNSSALETTASSSFLLSSSSHSPLGVQPGASIRSDRSGFQSHANDARIDRAMLPRVRAIGANISDGAMPRSIASPHRARVRRCPHARARSSPDILPYRAGARVLRPSRTWTPSIGASRAASSWIWRRKFSIVSILGRPSRARVARVYEIADGARARMDKHRPRFRGRRGRAVARARRRACVVPERGVRQRLHRVRFERTSRCVATARRAHAKGATWIRRARCQRKLRRDGSGAGGFSPSSHVFNIARG